jgi:hypothetical protein
LEIFASSVGYVGNRRVERVERAADIIKVRTLNIVSRRGELAVGIAIAGVLPIKIAVAQPPSSAARRVGKRNGIALPIVGSP